ncbi:hypothetical protein [Sinorhizobium sp. GL28]|uniref:hypothetical protein n=1 Tax=Sinorhizobium sp. GL28 TaxID=1358418 RepID=UPI0007268997|nr:hypothetical protein [Sinorhizobium sp. GL28]KSV95365.1 hypothetical protein N184_00015 [Sinorhizobium sp. GL28]
MQKLRELGRRRLWVRLPKFRRALEADVCPAELNDLFEAYALAAERLEELREAEQPDQRLVFEYEVASRGIEEEVTRLLDAILWDPVNNPLSLIESGPVQGRIRIRAGWPSSY